MQNLFELYTSVVLKEYINETDNITLYGNKGRNPLVIPTFCSHSRTLPQVTRLQVPAKVLDECPRSLLVKSTPSYVPSYMVHIIRLLCRTTTAKNYVTTVLLL